MVGSAGADSWQRWLRQPGDSGGAPPPPTPRDDLEAWAGPARAITLPELLRHAVGHVPALARARLDIEIAEARIIQTQARDDWQLSGQLSAFRRSGGIISGQAVDRSLAIGGSADVARAFSTGGTLTLHGETQYNNTSFVDPTADGILGGANWQHELSATWNQPLLRGRGKFLFTVNEARARLARDAASIAKRAAVIDAVQALLAAYWDLVFAERQLAITRSSLELARERLRITQIGTDGGKVPRSELPAVQQIIATREEEVLGGELAVVDRSIAVRRAAGLAIQNGELALRVPADLAIRDNPFELGPLIERAYNESPELAQFAKQDAIAALDIEVTESGLLPRLDAALTIGSIGADRKAGTAIKNIASLDTWLIGGTVTFQHSLGQENVRGLATEQRATRKRIQVTADDVRAQLAQVMSRAVAQIELAKRRVALSERAIVLANQNIQIETDRFNLGKATNFDILNRQEELRQSELRKAQAMIDWHKAEIAVQALTGELLPSFGVAVD